MKFTYYTPIVLQKISYVVFFILYRIIFGIEIKGVGYLKGVSGPVILALNHTHELDVTVLPLVLGFFSKLYPIYFVANSQDKYKTFGWRGYLYGGIFFNMLGGYSVYSGHHNYEESLENHLALLRQGRTVCIFPEGKRTRDGKLNRARGGLGYLVYSTNASVLPIAIDTFFNISFLDLFLRRRRLEITVGAPLDAHDMFIKKENLEVEDFRNASQIVLDKIETMLR